MEWPKLLRHTKGMKVRTKHPLQNGFMNIPVGTLGVIESATAWSKMHFKADPCPCCGVAARMSSCDKFAFEPVALAPNMVPSP